MNLSIHIWKQASLKFMVPDYFIFNVKPAFKCRNVSYFATQLPTTEIRF